MKDLLKKIPRLLLLATTCMASGAAAGTPSVCDRPEILLCNPSTPAEQRVAQELGGSPFQFTSLTGEYLADSATVLSAHPDAGWSELFRAANRVAYEQRHRQFWGRDYKRLIEEVRSRVLKYLDTLQTDRAQVVRMKQAVRHTEVSNPIDQLSGGFTDLFITGTRSGGFNGQTGWSADGTHFIIRAGLGVLFQAVISGGERTVLSDLRVMLGHEFGHAALGELSPDSEVTFELIERFGLEEVLLGDEPFSRYKREEALADGFGIQVLAAVMKEPNTPSSLALNRYHLLAGYRRFACEGDGGASHPSAAFRRAAVMRDPEIRRKLGCDH